MLKPLDKQYFSFKRFKEAIDEYEKWTLDYTKSMMKPMVCFTTFANAIFAALIIAAYLFVGNQITDQFILNFIFLYFNYIYFNNYFNENRLCR